MALFVGAQAAAAENVTVSVDATAATAVLTAVRNPTLSIDEAMQVAKLPGNQGLIRKAKSYGRTASDQLFAQALVAAAHHDTSFVDVSKFRFDDVRDHAAATEDALTKLNDPRLHLLDAVKARIAAFTSPTLKGRVTGYLIVGGTSGGFAFGEPQFFLNLDRFPSAVLASTIMKHELYHAVQALAREAYQERLGQERCIAAAPHGTDIAAFFASLSAEGTASYVGDVLSLPEHGTDAATSKERARVVRNIDMVDRSIVQLELSIHGLTSGAAVTPEEVYGLGFYGDEVLYALGYVMARAIAQEQGNGAIAELAGAPGAIFVERYASLKGYGKSDAMPALKPETLQWAQALARCSTSP
ncbi:hypothetical protein KZ810_12815 [Sphingomonas sp. RHCKR47]|uniref:DUF5700 domain-containing putative Zn-dependent protease n=1 Tax=Sphingomonas citricola TaxID=2862498 RepID=UPI001CA4A36A|nr:DUF5700 domain-containing putative Zn-dependent protease [Sphingomonas citricola]MBW6524383.1 hypothetical protein [Sphingomonas citricola]